ncbi:MAG: amino acid ABC transporter substrate-binding protein, partial [Holosporales bacterium]
MMRILFFLFVVLNFPAHAGTVLDAIKARGNLRCGVNVVMPGFSAQDKEGRWRGLDVEFCRAVSAAVCGDAEMVGAVPLSASERVGACLLGIVGSR